jgi:hypothetical protein
MNENNLILMVKLTAQGIVHRDLSPSSTGMASARARSRSIVFFLMDISQRGSLSNMITFSVRLAKLNLKRDFDNLKPQEKITSSFKPPGIIKQP